MNNLQLKKGNIILYLILLVLTILLMVMLKQCDSHSSALKSSDNDTLDIAIEYSPLSLYTYNDTLGGFNYDIINSIAKQHNLSIKFHPAVTLQKSLDGLQSAIYDVIIADIPRTEEIQKQYLLTEPTFLDKQVLIQRKDSNSGKVKIKSQLDLAQDTVWIVAGSPIKKRISNLSEEIGDTIYINEEPIYASEQLFLMVATGDINYAVINEQVAKAMQPDYPQVNINTDISFTQFQSWILNKNDSTLCDSINQWIKTFKTTHNYQILQDKYLK